MSGRTREREKMVEEQVASRGVRDAAVLEAMSRVPRERFVLPKYEDIAYSDRPLPIEDDQTISQPYIVALMTELSQARPGSRVLEVGTGSGYQAAVLAAKERALRELLAKIAGQIDLRGRHLR